MSLYFCHTYFENLKLFWSDIIWLSLHFQWICTKKSTLISITRVIFNKRLYIWRSNHYKTNYCKETNFVCGTVIVSRDARRSKNLGGLVPSIIKRSFDRAGFSLHFSKIWERGAIATPCSPPPPSVPWGLRIYVTLKIVHFN